MPSLKETKFSSYKNKINIIQNNTVAEANTNEYFQLYYSDK